MKRIFTLSLIIAVSFISILPLQGCESEQARLEKERTRLEIDKLKREAEEKVARDKATKDFFKTDKLKDFKPSVAF